MTHPHRCPHCHILDSLHQHADTYGSTADIFISALVKVTAEIIEGAPHEQRALYVELFLASLRKCALSYEEKQAFDEVPVNKGRVH